MRTDLMNAAECGVRYEAEPTERNAIALSLEKHQRARKKRNWNELQRDPEAYFYSDTCALCRRHHVAFEPCRKNGLCCLRRCGGIGTPWTTARDSVDGVDIDGAALPVNRPAFMEATLRLVRKLERALADVEVEP